MAENTKIEWAHHTFNPWEGCQKVGPGCDNCYAETRNARFAGGQAINWGPGAPRRRTSAANWQLPIKWNKQAQAQGIRYRVFCSSLADVFDNEVGREWRDDLATLILTTPHLDWLLLTKRIGNAGDMLGEMFLDGPPDNVWIGATIVNQAEADRDIPKLLALPARVRFLSMEPLLGPVDLMPMFEHRAENRNDTGVHWVIVGGESGHNARPMHPDWARALRDQCEAAGVPFLFKQWGEWREPVEDEAFNTAMGRAQPVPAFIVAHDGTVHCFENERTRDGRGKTMLRVGKKAAGRLLDGCTWDEVPTP